jgi:twinkle protein
MEERKLTWETLATYRITEGSSPYQIAFPYYRDEELISAKYLELKRPGGKKLMHVTPDRDSCLFGWQAILSQNRTVALVEGEIDAMTLYQYGLEIDILSVPFGGGTGDKHRWVENEFEKLAIYNEIFLCLDNDKEGETAAQELITRLGRHRCRIVRLPYKDINECLQQGVDTQIIKARFEQAFIPDPIELKSASSYVNQVIQEIYPSDSQPIGYELPWDKTKDKLYFRPDELSIWTGINGHGKSQFLGQVILHSILQGARVCIASLELKPKRLLARLTRQASGLREPSEEYIQAIHDWYGGRLWLFDLVGTTKSERLLEVFKYAKQRYDIDVFVIDSFMKCGIPEDDLNAQKNFIEQLCDFKNEYNCHIHLVVHPRKGADELKIPGKLDIKGSGAIADLADNCFTIWRNKPKEDEIRKTPAGTEVPREISDKFDCLLFCDKQRNGEWEGKVTLWFNSNSFQYLENRYQRPRQFVEFSSRSIDMLHLPKVTG